MRRTVKATRLQGASFCFALNRPIALSLSYRTFIAMYILSYHFLTNLNRLSDVEMTCICLSILKQQKNSSLGCVLKCSHLSRYPE